MRLAQESRPEGISSLYIYSDPGSYEPLARVDKAGKEGPNRILYFHTDVNGAPEEMTDSDGKIVWETGYQVWGNTIQEKDHGRVEQNLRYQDSTSTGKRDCTTICTGTMIRMSGGSW